MSSLVFFKKDEEIIFLGTAGSTLPKEIDGTLYLNSEYVVGVSSAEVINNPELAAGHMPFFLFETTNSSLIKKDGQIVGQTKDEDLILELGPETGFDSYDKITPLELEILTELIEKIYKLIASYEESQDSEDNSTQNESSENEYSEENTSKAVEEVKEEPSKE